MARNTKTSQKARRFFYLFAGILLASVVVWMAIQAGRKFEGKPPVFELTPPVESIGISQTLNSVSRDTQSGLKRLWVSILQDETEAVLLDKTFESDGWLGRGTVRSHETAFPVNVAHHGLKDGKAILRVKVSDYSWRGWWKGNRTYKEFPILIDTEPPTIEVLTSQHNLNQGGTGLAVYELSESVHQSGMQVGDRFFPGYPGYFDKPSKYLVFFALPHTMGPDTQLYVSATDGAGNTAKRGILYHINAKAFAEDTLHISDAFLRRKMPEFEPFSFAKSPPDSLFDQFLAVNQDLRRANYDTLQGVCQTSDGQKHWDGPFLRLPGSARKAGFADRRTYMYNGKAVDKQHHLGIDLASTARSSVPASNAGKVCFADDLGIYGKTVIIDHGFSLFSMYSHLSRLSVSTDQLVSKGDPIGLTGTTGMAGGDHLHFSMLVQGTFVNPVEWWDDNWIKHNITDKLTTRKQ